MRIEELYKLFQKHPLICTDSRAVTPGSLFFGLKGQHYNGNCFAAEALGRGCVYAVIDQQEYIKDERYLLVKDVLTTLQELAALHRKQYKIPILAVTGSNGKTTTKELCQDILSSKFTVVTTKGNLNNHIGVPVTLLRMRQDTTMAVIEMGANHAGEIASLCRIAQPTHGLITNIGRAHLEGFKDFEGVIRAKKELYDFLYANQGMIFINGTNTLLNNIAPDLPRVVYGAAKNTMVSGEVLSSDPFLSVAVNFTCSDGIPQHRVHINTMLVGNYNLENILAAACVGIHFGVGIEDIAMAVASYRPSNFRSQYVKTVGNTVILDAYNANPSSMELAIQNFMVMRAGHKAMILGDMLELGEATDQEHRKILDIIGASGIQQVMLVGPVFSSLSDGPLCFSDTAEAISYLKKHPLTSTTILIKGSRVMQLEKLMDVL
jgi:UDP-N-acetylmuramoyl-tripeptide--D-alanyl-D-alanine ligase